MNFLSTNATKYLEVLEKADKKQRNIFIPLETFNELYGAELVDGSATSARISANGRAFLLRNAQEKTRKKKGKKK